MLRKLAFLLVIGSLVGCSHLPDRNWDGYKKAENTILLGSQINQLDNKANTKYSKYGNAALSVIRTLRILKEKRGTEEK